MIKLKHILNREVLWCFPIFLYIYFGYIHKNIVNNIVNNFFCN